MRIFLHIASHETEEFIVGERPIAIGVSGASEGQQYAVGQCAVWLAVDGKGAPSDQGGPDVDGGLALRSRRERNDIPVWIRFILPGNWRGSWSWRRLGAGAVAGSCRNQIDGVNGAWRSIAP